MELILIRHTNVNIEKGICYGLTDVDVANTFKEEATCVSNKIKHIHIDKIWHSPAKRCTKLAQNLFETNYITSDARLLELNFGDWEGKTWDDIFAQSEGKSWMNNFVETKCPNGESFQDQMKRVQSFYEEMIQPTHIEKVAIVTHAGTIRAFLCLLQQIDPLKAFDQQISYGDIIKINIPDTK